MANFTPTTNANAIPTIIAQETLRLFPGYLNLAKFVSKDVDWTGKDFANFGQTLEIVKPGTLSTQTKTPGSNYTNQAVTADKLSVSLDQHKYISLLEEDITKMLQKPDLQAAYARDAAIKLAEEVETFLFGLHPSATYTETFRATNATTVEAGFLAIRSRFARNKVPQGMPKAAFLDTSVIDELLKIDKYSRGDYIGNTEAIQMGAIRRIYGINIFESQVVPSTGSPVAYHNAALTPLGMVLVNRPMPLDGNGKGVKQTNFAEPLTGLTFRLTEGYSLDAGGSVIRLETVYGGAIADPKHYVEVESF